MLILTHHNPIARTKEGRLVVNPQAGWCVKDSEFLDVFSDTGSILAQEFKGWLLSQKDAGRVLKERLLEVYCNEADAGLRAYKIEGLDPQEVVETPSEAPSKKIKSKR